MQLLEPSLVVPRHPQAGVILQLFGLLLLHCVEVVEGVDRIELTGVDGFQGRTG